MALQAASWPREEKLSAGLIWAQRGGGEIHALALGELTQLFRPGDLLLLNDAATLPASFFGKIERGDAVELRLLSEHRDGQWTAILFGDGDWREPTENRAPPQEVRFGDTLTFSEALQGRVIGISDLSKRLIQIRFNLSGGDFFRELYAKAHPVQYSYLQGDLSLWHVQSPFSGRPWAFEMPSAGAALSLGLLGELRRRGIGIASLTHACGLSTSGDLRLDESLPLGERYEIPEKTVALIHDARKAGGRIVAAGTSVMRALEGNVLRHGGFLFPGAGETELLIGPGYVPKIVDGLLTGIHEVEESHYRLAASLLPESGLNRILDLARKRGLKSHEFGDLCLIL